MTQATEVAIATDAAIAGLSLLVLIGLGMVVGRMLRRATASRGPHTHLPGLPGVLATGFRHCPAEQRTRAAVIRKDGTAACLDCGAHASAPEVTR